MLWNVSRETSERLEVFAALLLRWNARINLIGRSDEEQVRKRHIADSLQLAPLLPPSGSIADLGSGGGFPGLIVAIATDRPVTLIESDHRKAAFLREASRITGASTTIVCARIEDSGVVDMDIVTARALAPLDKLLDLAAPLLAPEGTCLFLKGAQIGVELTAAERRWQMAATRHPSQTTVDGCILEVRHLRPLDTKSV